MLDLNFQQQIRYARVSKNELEFLNRVLNDTIVKLNGLLKTSKEHLYIPSADINAILNVSRERRLLRSDLRQGASVENFVNNTILPTIEPEEV